MTHWRTASGDTSDAALIEKIAGQSQAVWLTGENASYTTTVEQDLSAANGAAVVFVARGEHCSRQRSEHSRPRAVRGEARKARLQVRLPRVLRDRVSVGLKIESPR